MDVKNNKSSTFGTTALLAAASFLGSTGLRDAEAPRATTSNDVALSHQLDGASLPDVGALLRADQKHLQSTIYRLQEIAEEITDIEQQAINASSTSLVAEYKTEKNRDESSQIEKDIAELQNEYTQAEDAVSKLEAVTEQLEKKLDTLEKQNQKLQSSISSATGNLQDFKDELAITKNRTDAIMDITGVVRSKTEEYLAHERQQPKHRPSRQDRGADRH